MATAVLSKTPRTSVIHAAPASRASWCGQNGDSVTCAYPSKRMRQSPLHPKPLCGSSTPRAVSESSTGSAAPKHGAVTNEEIVKGYPYQTDQYVRLSEAELLSLQPVDEKTIELKRFLDPARIDLTLLAGRTLSLLPANAAARPAIPGSRVAVVS